MMDREKREKERQEVFEATWRSYRTAIQNALTLQEQTLEFARTLLEGPTEALQAQTESNRATLDGLAEQSGRQRATLENLIRESANVYLNVIQAPFSYYQEILAAMMASWASPGGEPESRTGDLPLADYDSMNVREVSDKLDELSIEEIRQLRAHEAENKNRRTLIDRFDARIDAAPSEEATLSRRDPRKVEGPGGGCSGGRVRKQDATKRRGEPDLGI